MLAVRPGSGDPMAHTDIPSSDLRDARMTGGTPASFRAGPADLRQLERDLAEAVDGEVRFDARS